MAREPIDLVKFNAFHAKIQKMADKTFGRFDADEGSWCEVKLIDRTRGFMPPFSPMPRLPESFDEKSDFRFLEVAQLNLQVASSQFEMAWKLYQHSRRFKRCPDCRNGFVHLEAKKGEPGAWEVRKGEWRKSVECSRCGGKCEIPREG
jgi:hypothetical protein